MDTTFGSESQSHRVASSSVSVGPKKRETYRQRVLRFASTALVAEVLCPEATAIADMEAEWVRTSPSAIPEPSKRFGKRLKDGDMQRLKQLQHLEHEYLHGRAKMICCDKI